MLYNLLAELDKRLHFEHASAHCDIPGGIYDPIGAQIAALTVVRMIDLLGELDKNFPQGGLARANAEARYIAVKEEHAEKVKHEVRVIWGDYIKPPMIEKHPEVQELTYKIMQLGSKGRQTVDRDSALQLVEAVNQFAAIFWDTKNIPTKRAKAPYAPNLELVYPVLS
jgi:nickel superoxide dismutase